MTGESPHTMGALWVNQGWPPYPFSAGAGGISAPWVTAPMAPETSSAAKPEPTPAVISVYLDNGVVFEYDVVSAESAREHVSAIVAAGYRSVRDGRLTHYPPHRILKVCATGQTTLYPDRIRGT